MNRNFRLALIAACAPLCAFAALPAQAQDVPDPEGGQADSDIVVEGTLEIDGVEARQQAHEVTVQRRTNTTPLARFNQEVCPGVWGLTAENAQAVIDRIYDNAVRAGVQVDQTEGCRANMWLIVVDDPHQTFRQMREDDAFLLDGLDVWERRRILEQQGPAIAWNVATMGSEEGNESTEGDAIVQVTTMSRLNTGMRHNIVISVVLIARSALAGIDAHTLADYATMRLLAQTRPPEEQGQYGTILALFDPDGLADGAPTRLSDFDMAYLRSLYRGRGTAPSMRAHSSLDELMEEEMLRE